MDTVLASITALSLVLAVGMGVIAIRLLREESRRADARVALLADAAAPAGAHVIDDGSRLPPQAGGMRDSREDTLFAAASAPPRSQPRLAAAIAFVFVVGTLGALLLGRGAASPSGPARALSAMPLELVALSHAYVGNTLEIRGEVQNPPAGAAMEGIVASVQLFGADGAPLGSARAPLDFPRLAPGAESPFVISVPAGDTVSRYRVGFRSAAGAAIAHVDRRPGTSSARSARGTGEVPWSR